jgi:succinyl-CoA:acetate CoA-transferase
MHEETENRIRLPLLRARVTSATSAAQWIRDGMTVGMSGFTRAGDAKAVPLARAERARQEPLKITLMTGASLGGEVDKTLTEAGVLARRMPFQADPVLRAAINRGEVMYVDQHLSETVEMLRTRQIAPIDIAIIEAVAITETGALIPTTSVGNSASFAILADKVIVEINLSQSLVLEGLHDIFIPKYRPMREPMPLMTPHDRIGTTAIEIAADKIVAIVFTKNSTVPPPSCHPMPKQRRLPASWTLPRARRLRCRRKKAPRSLAISRNTKTGWCCVRKRSATTLRSSGDWASSPSTPRWRPISMATSTPPMCWAPT